jgi:UDP-N-acetylmuramate--alanine ligase
MVVEADEYDYSFLWLRPQIGVITNIDYDHPDIFPDQESYDEAFLKYVSGYPQGTVLAVNSDDSGVRRLIAQSQSTRARIVTYGHGPDCHWQISGCDVRSPTGEQVTLALQVPGSHNISNATGALIMLTALGHPLEAAASAVGSFTGVGRRFDFKGEVDGITVVDDYAHHPKEILVTIAAARERFPGRRIVAAFQPHTYSRTKMLVDAFAQALETADLAIVLDIYAARETDSLGISAGDIVSRIPDKALAGGKPTEAIALLADTVRPGDVVLTMGAGDITTVGSGLVHYLGERSQ